MIKMFRCICLCLGLVAGVTTYLLEAQDAVTGTAPSAIDPQVLPPTQMAGTNPKPSGAKLSIPISSLLDSEWGMLEKPGLNLKNAWDFLVAKKSVKAAKTYDCTNSPIVVALIDTGVDFKHPNLQDSKWVNEKEAHGKAKVDDDGNGFKDDMNGWDFTTDTAQIVDGHGHGTHLAGIISGKSSEPNGFKGVCPGVKIMSLRYFANDLAGLKNLENTVKAIHYAVKSGANIINYSGGGASFAHEEYAALKEASEKGILVVAAAGNERSDTELRPYFPASYDLPNILSVAGIGPEGKLIPASNWGKSVSVAAPGGGILSLQQNKEYGFMNGTSQATAFVTGLSALVWTVNPKLTNLEVKSIVQRSVTKNSWLKEKVASGGYVDAEMAVKIATTFKDVKLKPQFKKASKLRVITGLQGTPHLKVKESN